MPTFREYMQFCRNLCLFQGRVETNAVLRGNTIVMSLHNKRWRRICANLLITGEIMDQAIIRVIPQQILFRCSVSNAIFHGYAWIQQYHKSRRRTLLLCSINRTINAVMISGSQCRSQMTTGGKSHYTDSLWIDFPFGCPRTDQSHGPLRILQGYRILLRMPLARQTILQYEGTDTFFIQPFGNIITFLINGDPGISPARAYQYRCTICPCRVCQDRYNLRFCYPCYCPIINP